MCTHYTRIYTIYKSYINHIYTSKHPIYTLITTTTCSTVQTYMDIAPYADSGLDMIRGVRLHLSHMLLLLLLLLWLLLLLLWLLLLLFIVYDSTYRLNYIPNLSAYQWYCTMVLYYAARCNIHVSVYLFRCARVHVCLRVWVLTWSVLNPLVSPLASPLFLPFIPPFLPVN